MNRRELFKGALAAIAAASIPIPTSIVVYGRSPATDALEAIRWLQKVQQELIDKICYPPCVLVEHKVIPMSTEIQEEALLHVNRLLEDLNGQAQEV